MTQSGQSPPLNRRVIEAFGNHRQFIAPSGGFLAASGRMGQHEWEPLTRAKLIGFAAGVGLFLLLALRSEPGFVVLLDHANLLFPEAGHPVVGLLSSRLEPYGGTLGQLMFPCVLAVAFWRKGQPLGSQV